MMNSLTTIKLWLQTNYHITVPDDWLEACLEWIEEENQDSSMSGDQLNNMVFEQWLMSDLRELKCQCLPEGLKEADKSTLTGIFSLQINSILDVGCSYYSQLQKIKGSENPNVHVTADVQTQKPWEPKPSRMLMMSLTDGSTDVQGIEHKPIQGLNLQTAPGTKIIIHGNVTCRHGVLLLSTASVKMLGGEVDSLMETNTQQSVLQKALDDSGQNAGQTYHKDFAETNVRQSKKQSAVNQKRGNDISPMSRQNRTPSCQYGQIKSETSSRRVDQAHTASSSRTIDNKASVNHIVSDNLDDGFDDNLLSAMDEWDDDLNYDEVMEHAPVTNPGIQHTGHHQDQVHAPFNQHDPAQNITPLSNPSSTTYRQSSHNVKRSLSGDSPHMNTRENNQNKVRKITTYLPDAMDFDDEDEFFNDADSRHQQSPSTPTPNNAASDANNSATSNRNAPDCSKSISFSTSTPVSMKSPASLPKKQTRNLDLLSMFSGIPKPETKQSRKADLTSMFGLKPSSEGNKPNTANLTSMSSNKLSSEVIQSRNSDLIPMADTGPNPQESKQKTADLASMFSMKPSSRPDVAVMMVAPIQKDSRPSGICTDNGENKKLGVDSEPFTYLSVLKGTMPSQTGFCCCVKAYIATLTSKLDCGQGKMWSLTCKLNDGSETAEVDLADSVLRELIGFSSQESMVMSRQAKQDPAQKSVLMQGIKQCQQKLIDLSCIFKLEIKPGQERPKVLELIPVTEVHLQSLQKRVSRTTNVN